MCVVMAWRGCPSSSKYVACHRIASDSRASMAQKQPSSPTPSHPLKYQTSQIGRNEQIKNASDAQVKQNSTGCRSFHGIILTPSRRPTMARRRARVGRVGHLPTGRVKYPSFAHRFAQLNEIGSDAVAGLRSDVRSGDVCGGTSHLRGERCQIGAGGRRGDSVGGFDRLVGGVAAQVAGLVFGVGRGGIRRGVVAVAVLPGFHAGPGVAGVVCCVGGVREGYGQSSRVGRGRRTTALCETFGGADGVVERGGVRLALRQIVERLDAAAAAGRKGDHGPRRQCAQVLGRGGAAWACRPPLCEYGSCWAGRRGRVVRRSEEGSRHKAA